MKKTLLSAAFAVSSFFVALAPANAAVLLADTGWQDDTLLAAGSPTSSSPWTFTIGAKSILSIVDCCAPGDTFTLVGDLTGVTTFYAGDPSDIQASGDYGFFWIDDTFGKLAKVVNPGTYSFSVIGDGVAGIPAGLALRLDTFTGVPEPTTWAMMLLGVGFAGAAMRRKQQIARVSVRYA